MLHILNDNSSESTGQAFSNTLLVTKSSLAHTHARTPIVITWQLHLNKQRVYRWRTENLIEKRDFRLPESTVWELWRVGLRMRVKRWRSWCGSGNGSKACTVLYCTHYLFMLYVHSLHFQHSHTNKVKHIQEI